MSSHTDVPPLYHSFADLPACATLYARLLDAIRTRFPDPTRLLPVGIHSGGVWLAQQLAHDLGLRAPGELDVSFYRDDYAARGLHANVRPSQIGFAVDGAQILLVDDVLYTGRTTRAAINELFDYGRPASVGLAVLADRGGRELPVAASHCVWQAELDAGQSLTLARGEGGETHGQLAWRLENA